jgi:hypothetical protein
MVVRLRLVVVQVSVWPGGHRFVVMTMVVIVMRVCVIAQQVVLYGLVRVPLRQSTGRMSEASAQSLTS